MVSLSLQGFTVICRERQPPFHFLRLMRVYPVVQPTPLRIARIQFIIGQFANLSTTPCFGSETSQHARPAAAG